MTRDPSMPPDGFVSYVEKRLPAVIKGARRLSSDERLADDFARELFVPVAARWNRFARDDLKRGQAEGTSADRLVRRLFRQGSRDLAADQNVRPELTLDETPWPEQRISLLTSSLTPADEAALLWERAYRTSRRRLLIAGGAGVIGVALFLGRPRAAEPEIPIPTVEPPTTRPSRLPAGIDVLPALIDQTRLQRRVTAFPRELDLRNEAAIGKLGDRPAGRALAMFQNFANGTVLVLGPDGGLRRLDADLSVASTAVIAPDGMLAAFPRAGQIDLLDVVTAKIRVLPSGGSGSPPVWLDGSHIVAGAVGGSQIVDVRTGAAVEAPIDVADTSMPQGAAPIPAGSDFTDRVQLMLSVGQPVTAPARIRRYGKGFNQQVDISVGGDLGGWIGRWRGVGFGYGGDHGLLVRRCQVGHQLPEGMGEATFGLAVVRAATGVVLRLLLDTSLSGSTRTEALGWLDADTVLLSTGTLEALLVLAWRIDTGALELVSSANRGARIAVADLSEGR